MGSGSEKDIHLFDRESSSLRKPESEGASQDVDAGEENEDLSVGESVDEVRGDLFRREERKG